MQASAGFVSRIIEFASMLPKVNASIDFVENGKGRKAIITSLKMARESIKGKGGTVISQKLL